MSGEYMTVKEFEKRYGRSLDYLDWDMIPGCPCTPDQPDGTVQQNSGKDGSSYYDISINGSIVSCNDVIDALGLNFNMGEAFKALWRAGRKPGVPLKYDLDKAARFTAREAARHE